MGNRKEVGTTTPTERTTSPMAPYTIGHVKIGAVVFVLGLVVTVVVPLVLA